MVVIGAARLQCCTRACPALLQPCSPCPPAARGAVAEVVARVQQEPEAGSLGAIYNKDAEEQESAWKEFKRSVEEQARRAERGAAGLCTPGGR